MYPRANRQLVFAISLFSYGTSVALQPFMTDVRVYTGLQSVSGFFAAIFLISSHAWILNIWGQKSGPAMTGLHLVSSVGHFVGPAILSAFLSKSDLKSKSSESLHLPFIINFIFASTPSALIIAAYFFVPFKGQGESVVRNQRIQSTVRVVVVEDNERLSLMGKSSPGHKILILILAVVLFCGAGHVQANASLMMPKFLTTSNRDISESTAALMISGFYVSMAVGQVIGIFVSTRVKMQVMLCSSFGLVTLSLLLMLTIASWTVTGAWAAVLLMGFGCSCLTPSIYCLLHSKIPVTDSVCALLSICSLLFQSLMTLVTGSWMQTRPQILVYVDLISIVTCFIVVFLLNSTR